MKAWRTRAVLIRVATSVVALLVCCSSVLAQCALCRSAVTSSSDGQKLAQTLNLAVIVLLIPPVVIFCAIFVLAYRYRKAFDERLMEKAAESKRS